MPGEDVAKVIDRFVWQPRVRGATPSRRLRIELSFWSGSKRGPSPREDRLVDPAARLSGVRSVYSTWSLERVHDELLDLLRQVDRA